MACFSVLTFIYLLLCIFFLMKSSAESFEDEGLRYYDDFQSEDSFFESDGDDRYNPELSSEFYDEEKLKPNDEIISERNFFESDEHDRYNQEPSSNVYGEEETNGKRGYRQIGKLNLVTK